jgi:hypothetical protein
MDLIIAMRLYSDKTTPLKIFVYKDNAPPESVSATPESISTTPESISVTPESVSAPPSEEEINEMFQLLKENGFIDKTEEEKANEMNMNGVNTGFNHKVLCINCSKEITGIRWKCTICPSLDLCSDCEPHHDKSHPLIRITEELPNGLGFTFSLCTRLQQVNTKLHSLSEKTQIPIATASAAAHTAKEEISSAFGALTHQVVTRSKDLGQEVETLVSDASKALEEKFKKVQTRVGGVITSCGKSIDSLVQDTFASGNTTCCSTAPSNRYEVQLKSLEEMGFVDRLTNERLLAQFDGSVEACLEDLLSNPKSP